ncbi:Hypothetical_protein [Hexamita inflata]|uniref:Hypothetical_protein n=1 Tax=Hexamita inflata TaxID=28002 RepID=A0AA86Q839_9EUKA|nr:Hypothetical protein HINF_LOCUS24873 [Hexamita inflata]CAI9953956.1 Hypothetical protein HINF_LOCUS41601 [Hexamita inflata]
MLLSTFVLNNFYFCEWMFESRLWMPKYNCELSQTLNLDNWYNPSQNMASDQTTLDTRVVTAASLVRSNERDISLFKLLDLSHSGMLANAHIFFNVSISLKNSQKIVKVAPFGSFLGRLDNVSVSGCVNITIEDHTTLSEVKLSKLLGDIGDDSDLINHPSDFADEFNFRNVSSSLKYFINGVEIIVDGVQNNVKFSLVNAFDEQVNISQNTYQLSSDTSMHHFTYKLTDSVTSQTEYITAWFPFQLKDVSNDNSNALNDLYPYPLQMSLEKFYETKGMATRRFNATGFELEYPYLFTDLVVYQDNTKAAAVINNQLLICTGSKVFDIKTKACITRDECLTKPNQLIFQSTCVLYCPNNFFSFNKACYQTCPQHLGAYLENGICKQVPDTYFAAENKSVQTCSQFTFLKGCFKTCPYGTITQGQTCKEPVDISECQSGEYLILSGLTDSRYYNICSKSAPEWMYSSADRTEKELNVYKEPCSGNLGISNENIDLPAYPKDNGICQQMCGEGYYKQESTQSCHECISSVYDGGLILEPTNSKCIPSCTKYTLSASNKKICQDKSPLNCPVWEITSKGQYLCLPACKQGQFLNESVCSYCDPQQFQQPDMINGGCICLPSYFQKTLQPLVCTECDTHLHYKDFKEGSVCVCIDKWLEKKGKCVADCIHTQVFLENAVECSDCTNGLVPSVDQDKCVAIDQCQPDGFLNLAGTYCIEKCSSEDAPAQERYHQMFQFAQINALGLKFSQPVLQNVRFVQVKFQIWSKLFALEKLNAHLAS